MEGALLTNTNHPIGSHPVSVTVQIGAGAATSNSRNNGTPSYFGTPLTALGGGGAGRHINNAAPSTEDGAPGSGGGACDGGGSAGTGQSFGGGVLVVLVQVMVVQMVSLAEVEVVMDKQDKML